MVLRPYGRTAVFRAGRRARRSRRPPCRRVARETGDDSVRVGSGVSTPGPTSTRTRVRAVYYLNDEPQLGTPCRMGPQSREGLHSVLIFMRRFWQQFTHRGNFKQNSGCEWISATNHICPKPELAIVGKKCCGLRQSGGFGEVSAPQLFRGDALCLSKVRVCSRPKKTQPARKPACRIKSPL